MRLPILLVSTLAFVLLACSDDPRSPSTLPGTYRAASLVVQDSDQTRTDLLGQGAAISVSLGSNGQLTGHLLVPTGVGNGEELDVDLTGKWQTFGTSVRLNTDADVFLRDIIFIIRDSTLTGEVAIESTFIKIVLVKT